MKRIGITMRYEIPENILFSRYEYLEYIKDYFIPIFLPMGVKLDPLLDLCDCFLVTGGDDINPELYGDTLDSHSKYVDKRIDLLDKEVIEYAITHNKPLLGICRGLQALNVFLGGTLLQQISDDSHRGKTHGEEFILNDNSRLLKTVLPTKFLINSYHHQAIKELASDLVAVGYSNGIIEAVEHRDKPIFGLQWHPEKLNDLPNKKIIKLLADLTK